MNHPNKATTASNQQQLLALTQQQQLQHQQQLMVKKRAGPSLDSDSITILKKRILAHRIMRLKQVEKKHTEHVAEIYFLQTGGVMMEYPVWRKKGTTPELIHFMQQYRLDCAIDKSAASNIASTHSIIATASPTIHSIQHQSQHQSQTIQHSPQIQQVRTIFIVAKFDSKKIYIFL